MQMTDPIIQDGILRLAIKGRLDADGLTGFDTGFLAAVTGPALPAIVDFSEVEFMASLGMRLLIQAAKALLAKGARLVILGPQPLVAEVLHIAGLKDLTPVARDESEAVALAKGNRP